MVTELPLPSRLDPDTNDGVRNRSRTRSGLYGSPFGQVEALWLPAHVRHT